jgi:chorismate mutase
MMTDHNSIALVRLRAEIDCIDDQILELIERRLAASAATAALKAEDGGSISGSARAARPR